MRDMEKLKMMLCEELDEYASKGELSKEGLDTIHKLTDTLKNLYKIEMLEEVDGYSEYADRQSYARRNGMYYRDGRASRNSYRERDSLGRYASEGTPRARNYSREEAKSHIMEQIEDLMEDASDKEKQILQKAMRSMGEV